MQKISSRIPCESKQLYDTIIFEDLGIIFLCKKGNASGTILLDLPSQKNQVCLLIITEIPLCLVCFYRFKHFFLIQRNREVNTYHQALNKTDKIYFVDWQRTEAEIKQKDDNIMLYGHLGLCCSRLPRPPRFTLKSSLMDISFVWFHPFGFGLVYHSNFNVQFLVQCLVQSLLCKDNH